jgi:hypothetical protein
VTYLLLGLATYFLVGLVQDNVTAPSWAWKLASLAVGTVFAVAVVPGRWYFGAAVAGVAILAQRLDDLLLCRADESRFNVVKRYRQQ